MEKFVIPTPEFSLRLPISGENVKYRPFLVKEEKLFLMLKESKDNGMVIENLKKIMQRCILDETRMSDIAYADFEYLFLNMRVRSIGEKIIAAFIDKVFTETDVSSFSELSTSDQSAFIDSLSIKHIESIMQCVQKFPKVKANVEYTCTHCQHKDNFKVEGLENFFI